MSSSDEALSVAVEQTGLGRALELFPAQVKTAFERGLRPLGEPASGLSPIAHPAPVFDPARSERGE